MDAVERYQNNALFHGLVVDMRERIGRGGFTGEDIVEAAKLARRLAEKEAGAMGHVIGPGVTNIGNGTPF